jgi:uncharacterized repeat protein (TIGR02543 family)
MKKSIFRVVGIAAIAAVLCAGCELVIDLGEKEKKDEDKDAAPSYTLTATASIGGSVSREPAKTAYASGDLVIVTAKADIFYAFTGWTGASTSKDTAITIKMDGNKILTASFESQRVITYTLTTASTTGGSVKIGGSVARNPDTTRHAYGEWVKLTATADSNYTFTGWTGASTSKDTAITITMNGNKTLNANFGVTPPNITQPPEVNGLAGDWLIIETRGDSWVEQISYDDYKAFYSFKSSNDIAFTQLIKYSDFGIESISEDRKYSIKGDSVCMDEHCSKYSVSGDTLTLISSRQDCYDGGCHTYSETFTCVKDNIANAKESLGNVYSQDFRLHETTWRTSESDYSEIHLCTPEFYDSDNFYISDNDALWYTEGSSLYIVGCAGYETKRDDDGDEWERCVSYSFEQAVTLEYELPSNGTLRLRPVDSAIWDVWYDSDNYMSKSKATHKKGKRAVSPFSKASRQ